MLGSAQLIFSKFFLSSIGSFALGYQTQCGMVDRWAANATRLQYEAFNATLRKQNNSLFGAN